MRRVLFALLFIALPASAASPIATRIDSYVSRLEGFGYSGSVLLDIRGEVVLRKGYGYANRPAGIAYDADTLFDIGSMAKTFTAAAIVRLEQQQRLAVSDPIARHLPGVPDDKKAITIEQLLTHTSGLAGDVPSRGASAFSDEVGRDEVVNRVLALPLRFAPGADWAYSNGGYVLLAAIVEAASAQPYRQYVRKEIFTPPGLRQTYFWGEIPAGARVAAGHDELGNVVFDPATASGTTWFDLGGGQVVSSLDDLRNWILALASEKVLPAKQRDALFLPRTKPVSPSNHRNAYAWLVRETARGTHMAQHGGDHLGTGADLKWWIDDEVILVTSTNVRHDFYPTRNRLDRVVPGVIFGERAEPDVPAFVRSDLAPPAALPGAYRLPSGGTLHVTIVNGRTYIGAEGQDAAALLAPASAEAAAERAWRSTTLRSAIETLMRGEPPEFDALVGSTAAEHGFRDAVKDEIAALGKGKVTSVALLGSFPSGFPADAKPLGEATLLRLTFADSGPVTYAVHWAGRAIAATEASKIPYAAMVPLQQAVDRSWTGWNLITEQKITVDFVAPNAIRLQSGERTETATRQP
ncbi:MAG TPA: serine hydrolase domain-containing protein [Thermoanaerobaculia bacterium]|jgi:CubicO group peptidase (beta-lactamase class C family)